MCMFLKTLFICACATFMVRTGEKKLAISVEVFHVDFCCMAYVQLSKTFGGILVTRIFASVICKQPKKI